MNKAGFLKALSDNPEPFTTGFSPLAAMMRNLFLRKPSLWPRFHVTVAKSLEGRKKAEVIELEVPMSDSMKEIQNAILECVEVSISELRKAGTGIELDDWTLDSALHKSFDVIVRRQLDPIWHRVSYRTRQIVNDLTVLRSILQYASLYSCTGDTDFYPVHFLPMMRSLSINILILFLRHISHHRGPIVKTSRLGFSWTQQTSFSKMRNEESILGSRSKVMRKLRRRLYQTPSGLFWKTSRNGRSLRRFSMKSNVMLTSTLLSRMTRMGRSSSCALTRLHVVSFGNMCRTCMFVHCSRTTQMTWKKRMPSRNHQRHL